MAHEKFISMLSNIHIHISSLSYTHLQIMVNIVERLCTHCIAGNFCATIFQKYFYRECRMHKVGKTTVCLKALASNIVWLCRIFRKPKQREKENLAMQTTTFIYRYACIRIVLSFV